MNLLAYFFRQSKWLVMAATVAGLAAGFSSAGLIMVIGQAVSSLTQGAGLPHLALQFFGLCLINLIAKSWSEIALLRLTQGVMLQMRVTLSRRLLATPLKKLQAIGKPGLLAILTNDIDTFTQTSRLLPRIFGDVVVILACLGYMAWLSWQVFLFFVVCLAVSMAVFYMLENLPRRHLHGIRAQIDRVYANFSSLIEGSKELQLSRRRSGIFIDEVLQPGAAVLRSLFIRTMSQYALVVNTGAIMFYLVLGVILFGTPALLPGHLAVMPTIVFVLMFLIQPISELMLTLPEARQAGVSLQRIHSLEASLQPGDPPATDAGPLEHFESLVLAGVTHRSSGDGDEQFLLGPLNLTLHRGETLFVIGGNGSGKTTLALLLLGLYPPDEGVMQLNGRAVTEQNVQEYRQRFTAVFSDFHLFEQLLGADERQNDARALAYIDKLGLASKVKVVEGRFSTLDLSTGQRKRLALVASYLDDREVYLFDEWAADQDPVFKRVFYTELLPELKARGKTVIVITHDDAYFDCADRVLKLDSGQLASLREVDAAPA